MWFDCLQPQRLLTTWKEYQSKALLHCLCLSDLKAQRAPHMPAHVLLHCKTNKTDAAICLLKNVCWWSYGGLFQGYSQYGCLVPWQIVHANHSSCGLRSHWAQISWSWVLFGVFLPSLSFNTSWKGISDLLCHSLLLSHFIVMQLFKQSIHSKHDTIYFVFFGGGGLQSHSLSNI